MSKGQEGSKAQEQTDFHNEFARISDEKVLRAYEEKNRARIIGAENDTRMAFDAVWYKLTGNPYFQPVTTLRASTASLKNDVEAGNPKANNYREVRAFTDITWNMSKMRIGRKIRPVFTLFGVDAETGSKRRLFVNLKENRVRDIFGDAVCKQVLNTKESVGQLDGVFDLEVEGFWVVQFTAKRDENDTIDVQLLLEGQVLIMERSKPVPLPGFFIQVADNATRPHFTQRPGEGRKIIDYIQMYPYTVIRRSSYEEFMEMKSEGDRITREAQQRRNEAA